MSILYCMRIGLAARRQRYMRAAPLEAWSIV